MQTLPFKFRTMSRRHHPAFFLPFFQVTNVITDTYRRTLFRPYPQLFYFLFRKRKRKTTKNALLGSCSLPLSILMFDGKPVTQPNLLQFLSMNMKTYQTFQLQLVILFRKFYQAQGKKLMKSISWDFSEFLNIFD